MSRRTLDRWDWACRVAPGRLTATQRVILLVLTRHADEDGRGARIGQEKLSRSAGITDRAVRDALKRLESLGLISGERRPGLTTVWTVHLNWTPEAHFQGDGAKPRKPASRVDAQDPGSTPEAPRKSTSDEGEGEGLKASPPSVPQDVEREEATTDDTLVTFDPTKLVELRKVAS